MKKSAFLAIIIAFLLLSPAHSQDVLTGSGSTYSYLGLGTISDFRSSQASGMGLTGAGLFNAERPGFANPAFWGNSVYTSFSAGMSLDYFNATDNFGSSENSTVNFGYAHVLIPVYRNRFGIGLSIYPETQSRFNIQGLGRMPLPTSEGIIDVPYSSQNIGIGGINRIEAGFGLKVHKNLFVGYAPSLLFGTFKSEYNLFFNNLQFQPTNYTIRTRYRAIGHRFGLSAHTNSIFRNRDKLEFGAVFSLETTLDANRRLTSDVLAVNRIGTVELVPESELGLRKITYPMSFTAGATYHASRYFLVAAEVNYQQWSRYFDFDQVILDEPNSFTKDRIKVGAGVEYNFYNRGNEGFFNSMVYRAGVSYDTGHLTLQNTDISTLLFSVGLGVPVRTIGSSIDLNFDFGNRGTKSNNLVNERIFAFRASFNLSELMFLQRRLN